MGHAHHFLSRLDRLTDPRHLEDAKTLYNDSGIFHMVLDRAQLPSDCQRVAISLAHPVDGPWVITTRSGRFITCLEEGMRPARDDARIPSGLLPSVRGLLAKASCYIDAFARYVSRSGEPKEKALVGWVLKRPEQVSLEDARALVGLVMLAPDLTYSAVCALHGAEADSILELSLARKPHHRKQLTVALHGTRLSLAHLLAAVHAAPDLESMPTEPMVQVPRMLVPAQAFVSHSPPVAVRGLWALRTYASLDGECVELLRAGGPHVNASGGFAIGVASLVAVESMPRSEKLARLRELIDGLPVELREGLLIQYAWRALSDPDAAVRLAVEMARDVRARMMSGFSDEPVGPQDVSDASALANFYTFPHSRVNSNTGLLPWLVAAMPHFLRAPFEELYLPTAELEAVRTASARDGTQSVPGV